MIITRPVTSNVSSCLRIVWHLQAPPAALHPPTT